MDQFLRPEQFDCNPSSQRAALEWNHWFCTFNNFLGVLEEHNPNKLAMLIKYVSPSVYEYIADASSYESAIEILKTLYAKSKTELHARYTLTSRQQQAGETLDEFLQDLKQLSKNCNYQAVTADQYCEESIRDAFIRGLSSSTIREKLLENNPFDLQTTFDQAQALDQTQKSRGLNSDPATLPDAAASPGNAVVKIESGDSVCDEPQLAETDAGMVDVARGPEALPHDDLQLVQLQRPDSAGQTRQVKIWEGTLEWSEKTLGSSNKQVRSIPCQLYSMTNDTGEPEVKTDNWPNKMTMQLVNRKVVHNIGKAHFDNIRSVKFYLLQCEQRERLAQTISGGSAGIVYFSSAVPTDVVVMLLLYSAEKKTFFGFIPNDQNGFIERLKQVMTEQKQMSTMRPSGLILGGRMRLGGGAGFRQGAGAGLLQGRGAGPSHGGGAGPVQGGRRSGLARRRAELARSWAPYQWRAGRSSRSSLRQE